MLADAGADVNALARFSNSRARGEATPLDLALEYAQKTGSIELADFLRARGARTLPRGTGQIVAGVLLTLLAAGVAAR